MISDEKRREIERDIASRVRIAFRKALAELPEIAPRDVAAVLSGVHMRDEFFAEGKRLQSEHGTDAVAPRVEQECGAGAWSFMRKGVLAALEQNSTTNAEPDFAKSIAYVVKEESAGGAACGWRSCTGCHENNEGVPQGPYSALFQTHVGMGCSECGGIGVTWEYWSEADLAAMQGDPEPAAQSTDREAFERAVVARLAESGFLEIQVRTEALVRCGDGYQDELINAGWHYWQAGRLPQPQRKDGGEPCGECRLQVWETCDICGAVASPPVERRFRLEWIAGARPPVHPNPMLGRNSFSTFEEAMQFFASLAPDRQFKSLTETVTTSIDRSSDAQAALA